MSIKNQVKLAGFIFGAAVAFSAFGPGEARAAFKVKELSCTSDPFGVHVDVRGLGNTNICIEGSVTLELSCACANNGGNCTSDAKKNTTAFAAQASQAVEPKNGRVMTTFVLPVNVGDGLCEGDPTNLACPSGQDAKLVEFETVEPAIFTVCTTDAAAGAPCTCEGAPTQGDLPETITCGPTGNINILFRGKHGSCQALFQ
jgi:hypothetical protein